MSFQKAAHSLKSRLHLSRWKSSHIATAMLLAVAGATAVCIALVQLVSAHAFSVSAEAQIDPAAETLEFSEAHAEGAQGQEEIRTIVVYVSGCVAQPGLYELVEGERIGAAVELAGGPLDDAALESINLARQLVDGEQIHVPSKSDLVSGAAVATQSFQLNEQNTMVNINTAGVEQLTSLTGIGEATAQKIISDREKNGPFVSPEDLMRVSGIGEKKFESIKDRICV